MTMIFERDERFRPLSISDSFNYISHDLDTLKIHVDACFTLDGIDRLN